MSDCIYIRGSKDGHGIGGQVQLEACRAYASSRGLKPVAIVESETGKRWDLRLLLQQGLDQLERGDCLIVYRLDRLARKQRHLMAILEDHIELKGAVLHSVCENVDASTPSGRVFLQMLGAFAEYEGAMISLRTKEALARVRKTKRLGAVAYADDEVKAWMRRERDYGASYAALADALNKAAKKPPRGHTWYAATVRRILAALPQ